MIRKLEPTIEASSVIKLVRRLGFWTRQAAGTVAKPSSQMVRRAGHASACALPFMLQCHEALAGSPFATGASAMQGQLVSILTPLAAVAVMVSGVMAWFGRISWWWMVGVVLGTVLVFGGPQIVSWIRGMFGV